MLGFLFRTLTAEPARGAKLFAAVTAEARRPHWFVAGQVTDTLDGRFAMLSTVAALVLVRLERDGDAGAAVSVALTERFIEVMESEHRELGLGDPALGKKVRKLVGALSARTDKWRAAIAGERPWDEVSRESLHKGEVSPAGLDHCARELGQLWSALDKTDLAQIAEGRLP